VKVLKIALVPPPTIAAEASVAEALQVMEKENTGACAVLEVDKLVGVFSERDLMLRVMGKRCDPENICVRDVMSENLHTVTSEAESADALSLMMSQNIRHLLVVNDEGNLAGLLSMRNLIRHHVEELTNELNTIVAYFSADGPGG
jgi:CBS domain-containing protein